MIGALVRTLTSRSNLPSTPRRVEDLPLDTSPTKSRARNKNQFRYTEFTASVRFCFLTLRPLFLSTMYRRALRKPIVLSFIQLFRNVRVFHETYQHILEDFVTPAILSIGSEGDFMFAGILISFRASYRTVSRSARPRIYSGEGKLWIFSKSLIGGVFCWHYCFSIRLAILWVIESHRGLNYYRITGVAFLGGG